MSALQGIRHEIEVARSLIDGLTTELVALRDRVITLEAQVRSGQSTATAPATAARVTTPPVSAVTKSTSATTVPTSGQKPATGKS